MERNQTIYNVAILNCFLYPTILLQNGRQIQNSSPKAYIFAIQVCLFSL